VLLGGEGRLCLGNLLPPRSPHSLTYGDLEVALYKTTHETLRLETVLVLSPVDHRASNETPGSGRMRWLDRKSRTRVAGSRNAT